MSAFARHSRSTPWRLSRSWSQKVVGSFRPALIGILRPTVVYMCPRSRVQLKAKKKKKKRTEWIRAIDRPPEQTVMSNAITIRGPSCMRLSRARTCCFRSVGREAGWTVLTLLIGRGLLARHVFVQECVGTTLLIAIICI